MPKKRSFTATVGKDGQLPESINAAIRDELELYGGREVVIELRSKRRSTKASGYYWGVCISMLREYFQESGVDVSAQQIHDIFKEQYLTPETVEVMGRVIKTYSTSNMDSTEFYWFVEQVRSEAGLRGVFIPDPDPNWKTFSI